MGGDTAIGPLAVVERLRDAMGRHDLDAMVALIDPAYRSEQPLHPERGFDGREQVRKNYGLLFDDVPDLRVDLLAAAEAGDEAWSEWRMHGTRRDGAPFDYRGVAVFGVAGGLIARARLYFEPVEAGGGDIDSAMRRLVGRE